VTSVVAGAVAPTAKAITGTLSNTPLPSTGTRLNIPSPTTATATNQLPSLGTQAGVPTSGPAFQNPSGVPGQIAPVSGSPVVITSQSAPHQSVYWQPAPIPSLRGLAAQGGFGTFEPTGLLTTLDARDLSVLISHAREGVPGPQTPVANPSGVPPVTGAYGTGGAAASGGMGFFFFGIAALLSLAFLLMSRVSWNLRATALPIAPQPFISLLERPG